MPTSSTVPFQASLFASTIFPLSAVSIAFILNSPGTVFIRLTSLIRYSLKIRDELSQALWLLSINSKQEVCHNHLTGSCRCKNDSFQACNILIYNNIQQSGGLYNFDSNSCKINTNHALDSAESTPVTINWDSIRPQNRTLSSVISGNPYKN